MERTGRWFVLLLTIGKFRRSKCGVSKMLRREKRKLKRLNVKPNDGKQFGADE